MRTYVTIVTPATTGGLTSYAHSPCRKATGKMVWEDARALGAGHSQLTGASDQA